LKGASGKYLWGKMDDKQKKTFKFAAQTANVIPRTTNLAKGPDEDFMGSADALSPTVSPDTKMNVMNNVHADRATLGDNQASPTIITSETTNASVQSNPLTYVSGASSARGKPIPTSRSN
jgi:hypothetical protein